MKSSELIKLMEEASEGLLNPLIQKFATDVATRAGESYGCDLIASIDRANAILQELPNKDARATLIINMCTTLPIQTIRMLIAGLNDQCKTSLAMSVGVVSEDTVVERLKDILESRNLGKETEEPEEGDPSEYNEQ